MASASTRRLPWMLIFVMTPVSGPARRPRRRSSRWGCWALGPWASPAAAARAGPAAPAAAAATAVWAPVRAACRVDPHAGPPQAEAARSGDPGSRAGMPGACRGADPSTSRGSEQWNLPRNRTAPSHARTRCDPPPQHSAAGPPSRAALGGTEFAGRDCMETLVADVRLGLRMLLKAPAFTAVSLLALALGIGANTVMFSVANTVLLRPLAYRDARELMRVQTVQQDTRTRIGNSPPDFYRLR